MWDKLSKSCYYKDCSLPLNDPLRKIKLFSGSILEAGCGGGQAMKYCLKFTNHVVGLDFSKEMLLACKQNVSSEYASFVMADTRFIPFKNKSFDTSLSLGVIEHLGFQNLAFDELCRVSQKMIVLSLPFPFSFYHLFTRIGQLLKILELDKEDGFTVWQVEQILEPKGFRMKKTIKLLELPDYFEKSIIKKLFIRFADVLDTFLSKVNMGYRFVFYVAIKKK